MRSGTIALSLLLTGAAGFVGFAKAAPPAVDGQTKIVKMDDKAGDEKNENEYMQHLRATRKLLNDAKATFEADPSDKAGHRKEILEGIDKAINACDAEITEYKADMKK